MIIFGCIRKGYALYCLIEIGPLLSRNVFVFVFVFFFEWKKKTVASLRRKSNFWKRCKEQGKQANHKHGDFIDFSQEFLFSLSPGQTVEQSWIQRSNFAGSNIVRPFGRPCWMVFIQHFCLIKCWIEFTFVQTLYPTILLNETMLQCFVALPTKCYPEVSHMGPAGQSRIAILFSSLGFSRHLPERWRTKRTSWLLMSSQRARKEKKKKRKQKQDRGEASLEGIES